MKKILPLIMFLELFFIAKSQEAKPIVTTNIYASTSGYDSLKLTTINTEYKTGTLCRPDSVVNKSTQNPDLPFSVQSHTELTYNINGFRATETSQQNSASNINTFTNNMRTIHTYLKNTSKEVSILYQGWDGETWFDSSLTTFTYLANDTLQSMYDQIKIGNNLVNHNRSTYTYNGPNLAKVFAEKWDTATAAWKPLSNTNYLYKNNLIDSVLTSSYTDEGQETPSTRIKYTYDNNNWISKMFSQSYVLGTWQDEGKTEYTYYNTGKLKSQDDSLIFGTTLSLISTANYTWTANGNLSSQIIIIGGVIIETKITYDPCADVVMPIQLLDFKAVKQKKNVLLSWSTATEENSSYFQIERSQDNLNFVTIGKQAAAGNSNTRLNYTYTDNIESLTNIKKVFYRLKEVDKDGKYMYSPIAFVPTGNEVQITIVPNPAKSYINILHDNNTDLSGSVISIIDISGKTVLKQKYQNKNIPVANFARGVYIIQLTMPSGTITRKLIIN